LKNFAFILLIIHLCFCEHVFAIESDLKPFSIPRSLVTEVIDLESNRSYPLFIKLPKSYTKHKDKKYPVIYLTDANYAFQIVSGATRYPMNANKMSEAIIVGISYSKNSKRDSSRVRDYTPTINKYWRQQTGGAQQHMEFIEKSVFKYMAQHYRVDSNNRTFMGNSLGGLFGSYVLLTKPQLFKNYILGSPSYWFDNKYIFRLEAEVAKNISNINANVFISIGERETKELESSYDMVNDAKKFYKKMLAWKQPNLKTKILIISDANHQMAFPTTAIHGLHWVLGK
jgi:predicted alpha/beta superfamily hydrolase